MEPVTILRPKKNASARLRVSDYKDPDHEGHADQLLRLVSPAACSVVPSTIRSHTHSRDHTKRRDVHISALPLLRRVTTFSELFTRIYLGQLGLLSYRGRNISTSFGWGLKSLLGRSSLVNIVLLINITDCEGLG